MKKNITFFAFMILAVWLTSCRETPLADDVSTKTDPAIASVIADFKAKISPKSRAANNIQILSVATKHYRMEADTVVESRMSRADDTSFDLSLVNIKVDDSNGYAILSTDQRLNKVFFYTENGAISDTANIEALKDYVENIPMFAAAEIKNQESSAISRAMIAEEIMIDPIVPFKWGQNYPFNALAPKCSSGKCDGHMPIGCVATAMGQTIATIGSFKSTLYGSKNIDFVNLPANAYFMSSEQQQQMSHFFYEIALCCQMKFGCSKSFSSVKAAYQYLRDLGYGCTFKEGGIDCQQLITELQNGYPHMIGGDNGDVGHMWIVDGLYYSPTSVYFSCNWGWNMESDGWINGNPYTAKDPETGQALVFTKNIRNIYILSKPI